MPVQKTFHTALFAIHFLFETALEQTQNALFQHVIATRAHSRYEQHAPPSHASEPHAQNLHALNESTYSDIQNQHLIFADELNVLSRTFVFQTLLFVSQLLFYPVELNVQPKSAVI